MLATTLSLLSVTLIHLLRRLPARKSDGRYNALREVDIGLADGESGAFFVEALS